MFVLDTGSNFRELHFKMCKLPYITYIQSVGTLHELNAEPQERATADSRPRKHLLSRCVEIVKSLINVSLVSLVTPTFFSVSYKHSHTKFYGV